MTLLFPCLIQALYDEAGVLEVPGADHRVEALSVSQMIMIEDSANPVLSHRSYMPPTVILAQSEAPLIPTNLSNRQGKDVYTCMDFKIRKQREAPI